MPAHTRLPRRLAAARGPAALLAAALLLAGCGTSDTTTGATTPPPASPSSSAGPATPEPTTPAATALPGPAPLVADYLPDLPASLYVPEGVTAAPLVVMIPGGSWYTADPTALGPLAQYLAANGIAAMPAKIRAGANGILHPVPVQDILCATAYGVAAAEEQGLDVGTVVLLGHSSGAHQAALATLTPDAWVDAAATCPWGAAAPDALVGIAGPYDISLIPEVAALLLGTRPEDDPAGWEAANPLRLAGARPEVPVLLVHGTFDRVVPEFFSEDFAAALEVGGHDVTVEVIQGGDHSDVLTPDVSGEIIATWVKSL